ncbi:MAG: F0F1 ATP synthase subunit delta [Pseudomonadota bacterium]|nr:F0F1 ATP synthase subunit delta [Pseudomonadota bacterium]
MAGELTTIARPYAEAVFARALEADLLGAWSDALALLSEIAGNEDMAGQIANPNVPRERLRQAILEIAGDALSQEAQNLVKLLAENDRLAVLPEIADLFDALKTEHQGVRQVQVRTAYALNAAQKKELAEALKKRLGAEVELTVEKDPSLIGGIEIRAGDLVIDGSIRGKLHQLATELQI